MALQLLLKETINNGNMWTFERGYVEIKSTDEIFTFLIEAIRNDTLRKSSGWQYRFIANFVWCLKNCSITFIQDNISDIINLNCDLPDTFKHFGNLQWNEIINYIIFSALTNTPNSLQLPPILSDIVVKITNKLFSDGRFTHLESKLLSMFKNFEKLPSSVASLFGNVENNEDTNNEFLESCINNDSFLAVAVDEELDTHIKTLILKRYDALKNAPSYRKVISKEIATVLKTKKLSFEEFKDFYNQYPDLFLIDEGYLYEDLINLNEISYTVYQLDPIIRAYVLGFPIHFGIPGNIVIKEALKKLTELGARDYMHSICDHYNYPCPMQIKYNMEINSHYNSFDRVMLIQNDCIYEIKRNQWQELESIKHEYPEIIGVDSFFKENINLRLRMINDLNFPLLGTIEELILSVQQGEYCERKSESPLVQALIPTSRNLVMEMPYSRIQISRRRSPDTRIEAPFEGIRNQTLPQRVVQEFQPSRYVAQRDIQNEELIVAPRSSFPISRPRRSMSRINTVNLLNDVLIVRSDDEL